MKKIAFLLFLLTFSFACDKSNEIQELSSLNTFGIESEDIPTELNKVLRATILDGKIDVGNLNRFFQIEYGQSFYSIHAQLMQINSFSGLFSFPKSESENGRSQDVVEGQSGLGEPNIAEALLVLEATDNSVKYIGAIKDILPEDEEQLPEDLEEVFSRLDQIEFEISSDQLLQESEKHHLKMMINVYRVNFETILEIVAVELGEDPENVRTELFGKKFKRWAKRVWRRVRSVVVSTAVMVGAGFLAGGPIGAIIAGGLTLIGTSLDMAFNNVCHFAMQCPSGWMQDCTTGNCVTRDSWGIVYGGNTGTTNTGSNNSNGSVFEETVLELWYNQGNDESCRDNGRCYISDGSLTWAKLDQLSRTNGVYNEIQTKFSYLSSSERFVRYKQRLGRIFEDAVIRSLARTKNTKTYYESSIRIHGTIPDVVIETGTVEEKIGPDGKKVKHYFWWEEGAFIDAKTSQSNRISFSPTYNPQQIRRMINILSQNNSAETATNAFSAFWGWGTPVRKNAASNGAAILHIVTPGGTEIDDAIVNEGLSKKVAIWHSECDILSDRDLVVRDAQVTTKRNGINVTFKANSSGIPATINWRVQ